MSRRTASARSTCTGICQRDPLIVTALVSMGIIVASVVLRGVAVEPELRCKASHIFSLVRPGIFSAIGVISFAVSHAHRCQNLPAPAPSYSQNRLLSEQFVCHHNTMYIYKSIDTPTLDR